MHRFHLPPERSRGSELSLTGREAHHAGHVLRLHRGDPVTVLDGAGTELRCEVSESARDGLKLRVLERLAVAPLACRITLFAAVPRGKAMDTIVQKATELGAARIVPLLTERVVKQIAAEDAPAAADKWREVAIEAIKQCGTAWLPRIEPPALLAQVLERKENFDLSFLGSLQEETRHPREVFHQYREAHNRPPETAALWTGPEGDFAPGEIEAILAAGAQPVTFGPLVLRADTDRKSVV